LSALQSGPVVPGDCLGVVGGGQLGRMFAQAASRAGFRVAVLDPAVACPTADVAWRHIQAAYDDQAGLRELASICSAVTTEFENVPALSLRTLAETVPVAPGADAVEVAQDRLREKIFFAANDLPTNRFAAISKSSDVADAYAATGPEVVIKTARMGYDGKGQRFCTSADQAQRADALASQARVLATKVAERLHYVGVLAVEMFVSNGQLLLNEIAPRPHNSGHYTLDATDYSQFDQQVRAMCGLPVAQVRQHSPVAMLNILGDVLLAEGFDWQKLQNAPRSALHSYGKAEARAGRKMAHINILGDDINDVLHRVDAIKQQWPSAFS